MADVKGLFADPEFSALPLAQQKQVLGRIDADFQNLTDTDFDAFRSRMGQSAPGVPNPLRANPGKYTPEGLRPDAPGFLSNLARSVANFTAVGPTGSSLNLEELRAHPERGNPLNPLNALGDTLSSVSDTFSHPLDALYRDPIAAANILGAPIQALRHPLTKTAARGAAEGVRAEASQIHQAGKVGRYIGTGVGALAGGGGVESILGGGEGYGLGYMGGAGVRAVPAAVRGARAALKRQGATKFSPDTEFYTPPVGAGAQPPPPPPGTAIGSPALPEWMQEYLREPPALVPPPAEPPHPLQAQFEAKGTVDPVIQPIPPPPGTVATNPILEMMTPEDLADFKAQHTMPEGGINVGPPAVPVPAVWDDFARRMKFSDYASAPEDVQATIRAMAELPGPGKKGVEILKGKKATTEPANAPGPVPPPPMTGTRPVETPKGTVHLPNEIPEHYAEHFYERGGLKPTLNALNKTVAIAKYIKGKYNLTPEDVLNPSKVSDADLMKYQSETNPKYRPESSAYSRRLDVFRRHLAEDLRALPPTGPPPPPK